MEVGVDLADVTQSAQSAQTVYIWGAQATFRAHTWPYVATTSAQVTNTIRVSCPPGVKFRDFFYTYKF
jgi:hypothetical protein